MGRVEARGPLSKAESQDLKRSWEVKMNKGPCFVCGTEAILLTIMADKYDVRCDRCGKYFFYDGLNERDYKELPEEQRENISIYVREYNKATGKWAELGDINGLWMKIADFNTKRSLKFLNIIPEARGGQRPLRHCYLLSTALQ